MSISRSARAMLVAFAVAAACAPGCGETKLRNPFDGWQATPLETALATSKASLESVAEWYADACVLRTPGLEADAQACRRVHDDVAPIAHRAHNTAVTVAEAVEADANALELAITSTGEAIAAVQLARKLDESAARNSRIYAPLLGALTVLRLRLEQERGVQ